MEKTSSQPAPKVSVFFSSYNHARFLPACLDSILGQTYQDFEIVVVDDGSKDESDQILSEYQEKYPGKVRYFYHPGHGNRGISISCNLALSHTRGQYLAWTGSDDVWYPQKLEKQVALLDQQPQSGFVYSRIDLIDSDGKLLPGKLGIDITREQNPIVRLLEGNWIPASTVVFRRECIDQVGQFDEDLVYSDWDLWFRILSFWKASFMIDTLAQYRLHSHNVSAGIDPKKNYRANVAALVALRNKAASDPGMLGQPETRAAIELRLADHYFLLEEEDLGVEALRRLLEVQPAFKADPRGLLAWLDRFSLEQYRYPSEYRRETDFALWALRGLVQRKLLPSPELEKQLAFLQFASQAILAYLAGQIEKARQMGFNSIKANPRQWLRYSGLVKLQVKLLLGLKSQTLLRGNPPADH